MRLLPDRVLGVAVFHDPSPELVRRTETDVAPDLFQADPTALAGVPADRVLPVVVDGEGMGAALERALASTTRDLVLVDSAAKGGTGTPPNWARLGDLAVNHRLLLAGGLDHLNVQRAIEQVRPFGVDVSSGIERRPGEKDPALMRRFVTAARTAWADGMRRQGEML
jgi:phosphoribosylanthranilate isomerase